MFGFLKKGNEENYLDDVALVISKDIINTIGSALSVSKNDFPDINKWLNGHQYFYPPKGFWEDIYIIGFLNGTIATHIMISFPDIASRKYKSGILVQKILHLVCGIHSEFVEKTIKLMADLESKPESFSVGGQHGLVLVLIASGNSHSVSPDLPDFERAKKAVFSILVINELGGLKSEAQQGYDSLLFLFYKKGTLDEYITKKFPSANAVNNVL